MRIFILPLLFILLFTSTTNAQDQKKEQIAKALTDYFHLERENIHVHFDKNVFITNEEIWFKGYVFHRKQNMPFFATTNIHAALMDSEGKIIETQLLYGSLASFSGSFKLNDTMKSGKYYLQFYTNWMNNFTEDESAVYEVDIINPAQGIASDLGRTNLSKINISLHPEGGTMVKDCTNSVGISITDCNGRPVKATFAHIVNEKGEVLKKIPLNKMGYGRFDILADNNITALKAEVEIEGIKHRQPLPPAQLTGIALEINNYTIADKLIVKLKTNSITKNNIGKQPLYMVIQQDEKLLIHDFTLSAANPDLMITIPQKDIFDGINIIRILDTNLNQLSERIIFKYPQGLQSTELKPGKRTAESTELSGIVKYRATNLSVTVLPAYTSSLIANSDIMGSFLIAPYIESNKPVAARYYLETYSKARHYELDMFLINQKSKYKWRDIMQSPPKSTYTFDMGVSLKATLNNNLKNKKDYKVRVVSTEGMIDEQVDINEKGEIQLDHLILADSSRVQFSLLEKGVKKQELKLYPQIFNNVRKYNKMFTPSPQQCAFTGNDSLYANLSLPKLPENTIMLDQVEIVADKTALKYNRSASHSQLRGYKITEQDSHNFFYILDFIRYHGFDVQNDGANVGIYGRTVNTINGQRTQPMIYMDNMIVMDFALLQNIQTADVDEFYINQHASVPSVDNRMGIVRIYMKKTWTRPQKGVKDTNFIVKNGYKIIKPFDNVTYSTTSDSGFSNFGVIDWQPLVLPDSKGEFTLEIPNTAQKKVTLLIEGISIDGKLISELKTINLE